MAISQQSLMLSLVTVHPEFANIQFRYIIYCKACHPLLMAGFYYFSLIKIMLPSNGMEYGLK